MTETEKENMKIETEIGKIVLKKSVRFFQNDFSDFSFNFHIFRPNKQRTILNSIEFDRFYEKYAVTCTSVNEVLIFNSNNELISTINTYCPQHALFYKKGLIVTNFNSEKSLESSISIFDTYNYSTYEYENDYKLISTKKIDEKSAEPLNVHGMDMNDSELAIAMFAIGKNKGKVIFFECSDEFEIKLTRMKKEIIILDGEPKGIAYEKEKSTTTSASPMSSSIFPGAAIFLLVTLSSNKIVKYNSNLERIYEITSGLNRPEDIHFYSDGEFVVTNSGNNTITFYKMEETNYELTKTIDGFIFPHGICSRKISSYKKSQGDFLSDEIFITQFGHTEVNEDGNIQQNMKSDRHDNIIITNFGRL